MSRYKHSILAGALDAAPILVGIVPFGLVAGAAVIQAGLGMPEALGMTLLVSAGASQIVATTLFAEGAPLALVIGTALVVNVRMFIYSTSIAPVFAEAPRRLRPVLGHMLIDQTYAMAMTTGREREDVDVIPYYMGSWLGLIGVWHVSNVAGALLGALVSPSWGLDFAVPLVFLAMLAPLLKGRGEVSVALVTCVAAALLVPLLPVQTGLVAAIVVGIAFGTWLDASGSRSEEPREERA